MELHVDDFKQILQYFPEGGGIFVFRIHAAGTLIESSALGREQPLHLILVNLTLGTASAKALAAMYMSRSVMRVAPQARAASPTPGKMYALLPFKKSQRGMPNEDWRRWPRRCSLLRLD